MSYKVKDKDEWLREQYQAEELDGSPSFDDAAQDAASSDESAQDDQGEDGLLLPPWAAVQATDPPNRKPVLIEGVVRQGHIMLLSGKGKIGKSWSAIELCVSVATGRAEWFGFPLRSSGACLFIDPEIDPPTLDNRFHSVCQAMGVDAATADARISKWCLRGIADASMDAIVHDLQKRCSFGQFALVVIDSCSCFVEGDESKSVDVRTFSKKALRVAEITGATVLLVHHFGKAKDGDRSAADRARGSSVWLDFPEVSLTLTEVFPPSGETSDYLDAGEYACILEMCGNREFPRMEQVNLIFDCPLHRVDADGITDGWKPDSSQRAGGKSTAAINKAKSEVRSAEIIARLAAGFYSEGIGGDGLLLKGAADLAGCDSRSLERAIETTDLFELVQVTQRKRYVIAKNPPRASPPEAPTLDLDGD